MEARDWGSCNGGIAHELFSSKNFSMEERGPIWSVELDFAPSVSGTQPESFSACRENSILCASTFLTALLYIVKIPRRDERMSRRDFCAI
jgi:hypothetical protein